MMNPRLAIENIFEAVCDNLPEEYVKELIDKYSENKIYVFPLKDFDSFCDKHFHGQYLKVAGALYEAMDYGDFHENDEWACYNPENKCFSSADEIAYMVGDFEVFRTIVEKAIRNKDPILQRIDVKEELKAIESSMEDKTSC